MAITRRPVRKRSVLATVAFLLALFAGACSDTPEGRLRAEFEREYAHEPWFEAVDDVEVNGSATIVIQTRLDPLDPNVEELGVEICEAMARSTPSEDEVFVNLTRLVPGSQNVDGSYEEPSPVEAGLAETVSFEDDTCEAEMYEAWLDDQREALQQLDDQ